MATIHSGEAIPLLGLGQSQEGMQYARCRRSANPPRGLHAVEFENLFADQPVIRPSRTAVNPGDKFRPGMTRTQRSKGVLIS
jgi:hypothetical protein